MIDALDKWIGRLPGRLSFLAVAGGTLYATLSGASMGSVAMLGSTLVPEMEERGYKIVRFTNDQVLLHLDAVLAEIARQCDMGASLEL